MLGDGAAADNLPNPPSPPPKKNTHKPTTPLNQCPQTALSLPPSPSLPNNNNNKTTTNQPGLLEGAHEGLGLGHEFLRHVSRCRLLVHTLDGTSPDPLGDYNAINLELELFNPELRVSGGGQAFTGGLRGTHTALANASSDF